MELNLNLLKNANFFDSLYHQEIICQHNQYYIFNKLRDLGESCKQDRASYEPLNIANFMLARSLKNISKGLDKGHVEIVRRISQTVEEWVRLYDKGGVYDTFKYANEICKDLKSIDYPVHESFLKDGELVRAFICIPYLVKSFFQIHMVIADQNIIDFFNGVNERFKNDPATFYYVHEIKISRFVFKGDEPGGLQNCRNIKIVLLPGLVNSIKNPIINVFCQLLNSSEYCPLQNDMYGFRMSDKLSVSQGNFHYKQFLSLLGILRKVYDPEYNYAFINNN